MMQKLATFLQQELHWRETTVQDDTVTGIIDGGPMTCQLLASTWRPAESHTNYLALADGDHFHLYSVRDFAQSV